MDDNVMSRYELVDEVNRLREEVIELKRKVKGNVKEHVVMVQARIFVWDGDPESAAKQVAEEIRRAFPKTAATLMSGDSIVRMAGG